MNQQPKTNPPYLRLLRALALIALQGCAGDFDPGSRVTSLRELAVQADRSFAAPGETVHLSTLSYDPEERELSWAWATCVNPPASTIDGCLQKIAADAVASSAQERFVVGTDMTTFDVMVPSDALSSLPAESRPTAHIGVLSVICPGTLDLGAVTEGLPFACLDARGRALALEDFSVGIKRVRIRETDRNTNPIISGVTFDGAAWPADEVKTVGHCDSDGNVFDECDGDKHELAATVAAKSFESGTDEFDAPFYEDLVTEYYATEGIFENEVKISQDPKTRWVARKGAAHRELTLWFVVHDDRGGVAWEARQVQVK